ncbi:MAG: TonB-dependent receptor [Caulobacteraceae bacterium]|jgi:iron complex outermembrane receptor protein
MTRAQRLTRLLVTTMIAGAVLATPAAVLAQTAPAKPATANAAAPAVSEIIVTGSLIRRTDIETPSPVTAVSAEQLRTSGFDTLSSVLTNITANGAGTLSNNNSVAFAGGASGIALRGLSVGATLTLVDGQRMAPYPLSDDGERQFTDVASIPMFAIDSVEVDKDGASSIYGADAIAGVVNVKLKRQITGFEAMAEGGTSQHGGGTSQHYALSAGKGDLGADGYNVFITAEYRQQSSIRLNQREDEPWANQNYTSIGGNNMVPGTPTVFNGGLPATITPYLVSPSGAITFLGAGCNVATLNAGQCGYTIPQLLLAPTSNLSVLAGATKEFANGWEVKFRASIFDSKGEQSDGGSVIFGPNAYPGPSFGGNVSNPVGGTAVPGVGAIPNFTLPANYLGSGAPAGSYLEGLIPQLGMPTNNIDSKTYRVALDASGPIFGGWTLTGSLGFSGVDTNVTYVNYLNVDNLYTDLTTFNSAGVPLFNPLGGNSQQVLNFIAPKFSYTATDWLYYGELVASGKLMDLPGGDLKMAIGAEVIQEDLNNPGAAPIEAGLVGNTAALTQPFSTYAIGNQTNVAEFVELEGHLFHTLEVDASARDDWFSTYGNSLTPKVGVKWRPSHFFALRGTFSEGFRAPSPAEDGKSATIFGLGSAQDPVLCPNGPGGPFPAGTVPAACASQPGYVQTTNSLKPETSKSFTGGAVVEPIPGWSMTFDYYHITIKNQIISASELPTYFTPASIAANCVRGPDLAIPGVSNGAGGLVTAVPLVGPLSACFAGYVNAQSTETSGVDLETRYHVALGDNKFTFRAEWTHMFDYNLTSPSGVTFQLAGTHGPSGVSGDTGNPRDHLNASLTFEHGPFAATLSGYWISSFSVTDPSAGGGGQATCAGAWGAGLALAGATVTPANAKYCQVAAFGSVNFVMSYEVTRNVTVNFSMANVLDAKAPFDAETYGGLFTPYNPSLDEDGLIGRYFRVGVDFKL